MPLTREQSAELIKLITEFYDLHRYNFSDVARDKEFHIFKWIASHTEQATLQDVPAIPVSTSLGDNDNG